MTLEAAALECSRGERRLFNALSFIVHAGELVLVTGANGNGKTSLLRILCGLAMPEAGEVRWNGASIRAERDTFAAALKYLGHTKSLKDDLTAVENLCLSAALAGHVVTPAAARAALAEFGVGGIAELPVKVHSQGQRRRVALARFLLPPAAPLWILDEPFAALDAAAARTLDAVVSAHLDRRGCVVLTTHQDTAILGRASRRIDLDLFTAC